MGFWENEDETYPDVGQEGEENGVVYDSSEVQVDSIQGEKVRHHRFPDYDFFGAAGYEIAEADVVYEETDTVGDAAFEVSEEAALFLKRGYVDTTVNATSANVTITNTVVALAGWTVDPVTMNNVIITFNAARRVVLRYRIKADVEAGQNSGLIYPSGGGNSSLRANLGLYDSTNTIITSFENIIDTAASNGLGAVVLGIDSGTVTVAFDVAVGDYLQFECYYEISHNAVLMDFAMTEDASDTTFLLRDFDLSVVNNLVTKPLGIIVKDIYIPSDLRDRVQAVEIFYAKRNTNNSIIVDKSLVFDYNWNTNVFNVTRGRFHPFTMLNRQIEATPNYVKKYFEIRDNAIGVDFEDHMIVDFNNVLSERFTFLNSFRLRILDKQKYLPYDNIATIPSNDEREFCYYAEMNSLPTGGGKAYSWVALCNYRTNCYLSLEQQTLVSTGMLLIVNKGTGNQVDLESYGGDTFTNLLAVSLRYPANTIWVTHYIPIESVDNTSLRNELEDETFKYYPKSPFPNVWNDPNIDPALNQYDYYNRDYTALNDLVVQVIWAMFDELADYTSNFPYRIAYSEQTIDESVQLTWRDFKVDNYYEMPRDKGVITKIQGTNKTLFINHEYSMFVAQIKDKLLTNVTEIYLGTTNIFDRLPDEIVAIPEGYIGCTSQFACFVSKIGYIVIDRKQGKVFAVTDKLNEISNEFVREYLRDNLQTDSIDVTIDNPFTQFGITAGFDEKWNRLLISKVDYSVTPLMQGLIDANEVSFSENGFYVRELEFTTNFPIKSVTIPDVVLYMTKVTINGIDYVCDTPIQNNDYAGIQDFLGTIPFYMISYNPTYYANPFAQQRCQTFRCMNCLSTDVLKVTFSTTSDGLTAITEYTTANVGSFAPRYSTFIIDIALSEVVESLQLQDSYGSYVIEESPSNVNLIKAKIQKWCKLPNVEVSYVGTILTITIPYFAGGTNLFFTVTTANGGSAYALVDNYGATSNFTFYQIISYSDINYFFISNGFTLSYSPGKGWVCFHDYIPKYLFNNSNGIYSVENTANGVVLTGQVFKHNTEGKYGIYYDDTVHKSYVDVIFNFEDTLEKIIDSIIFTTKVVDPITGGSNALSTATHIVVYNDHQCSEEIAIISNPSSWYKHNARLINGTWHFDEFIDKVIDNTLPFIDDDGELILTNIQTAKTWFKRNLFIGKFGIVRIIYDNSVQNQFTLLSANVITEEVTR
jgi:hypothetical protein